MDNEAVEAVVRRAAAAVARRYEVEEDDLLQEGFIYVSTKADLQRCIPHQLGGLRRNLEQDLSNHVRTEIRRRSKSISYEERTEYQDDYAPRPASIAIRNVVSDYDRELIESLLPAVWDESFCYGIRVENAPDSDMPRGTTNKATGNTLAAHIADIKAGWKKAPLDLDERRTLLLAYGCDWKQKEIAKKLGLSQPTVSRRLYSGVGKIVACLNGDYALMFELCDDRLTEEAA